MNESKELKIQSKFTPTIIINEESSKKPSTLKYKKNNRKADIVL